MQKKNKSRMDYKLSCLIVISVILLSNITAASYLYCEDSDNGMDYGKAGTMYYDKAPPNSQQVSDYCDGGPDIGPDPSCSGDMCFVWEYGCEIDPTGAYYNTTFWDFKMDRKRCVDLGYTGCENGACVGKIETCSDSVKNQDESDVDCGGICTNKCKKGQKCLTNNDCETIYACANGICSEQTQTAQPTATCSDSIKNQDETGIDCGGAYCNPCPTSGPTAVTPSPAKSTLDKCAETCRQYLLSNTQKYNNCIRDCQGTKATIPKYTIPKDIGFEEKLTIPNYEIPILEKGSTECPPCLCKEKCEEGEYKCNTNTETLKVCTQGSWEPDNDYDGYCIKSKRVIPGGVGLEGKRVGFMKKVFVVLNNIFAQQETVVPGEGTLEVEVGEPEEATYEAIPVTPVLTDAILYTNISYVLKAIKSDGSEERAFEQSPWEPKWSPDGSKISYIKRDTKKFIIIDTNGRNRIEIGPLYQKQGDEKEINPVWSPDSSKIAYLSEDKYLHVVGSDGTNDIRIAQYLPLYAFSPVFSPDGSKLLFHGKAQMRREGVYDDVLYIINSDGTQGKDISIVGRRLILTPPVWTKDSTKFAYINEEGGINTYLAPAGLNMNVVRQRNDAYGSPLVSINYIKWDPSGNWLLYFDGFESKLRTVDAYGTSNNVIFTCPDASSLTRATPYGEWSPDGTKILFGYGNKVYINEPRGFSLRKIIEIDGKLTNAKWSAGGSKIAYEKTIGDPNNPYGANIQRSLYAANADGSNNLKITDDHNFVTGWSPEGQKLLYTKKNPASESSYLTWIYYIYDFSTNSEIELASGVDQIPPWQPI